MARTIDFNVHLPLMVSDHVSQITVNETEMTDADLCTALAQYRDSFEFLDGINLMIFNSSLLDQPHQLSFFEQANSQSTNCYFTSLVDFRHADALAYVEKLKAAGFSCIKFHSYVQKITSDDFERVLTVAKHAVANSLAICLDASYGTTGMFRYDNLALVCHLAESISDVPIVILHSGGIRCLEAMLIAQAQPNVFLETSFTLPYFLGSRIETDLAFVYQKIGADKIIYASDAPYVDISQSFEIAQSFFDRAGFDSNELDKIFYENANAIFQT